MQGDKPRKPARFYTTLTARDLALPWRAVLLPLGVTTLVASSMATARAADAQGPQPPRSLEDYQRAAFYKHLNDEVQRDPKTRGTILVIDPTPYPSVRSMLEDVEPKLKSMLPPWSFHPFKPPVAQMLRPLRLAAEFEDSQRKMTQRQVNPGAIMDTGGITGRSYRPTDKRSSAEFICMAVGTRATVTLTDFTESNYSKFSVFVARYTPAFQQAVNSANGNGKNLVLHELGHCVHGYEQRDNETPFAYTRRLESGSDAFEMLMRIRNNEPDMLNKLETNVQWRRANSVSTRNYDTTHDTSTTLRLIIDDLRQNPQMALELQRMTLTQIDARASAYADRAQLQEYPHLADKTLSKTAALAKTAETDSLIDMASRYISGKMVVAGYDESPIRLPVSAAVGMLQRAHTAENYLTQPPYSRLKQGIAQLRQQFPDEMRQAEAIFSDELRNYPPLSIAKNPRAPLMPLPPPAKPHHKTAPMHKPAPKAVKLQTHSR